MTTKVLVGYATGYGSTQEAAEAVAATLRECGLAVDSQRVREVKTLAGCDAVVLARRSSYSAGTRTPTASCHDTEMHLEKSPRLFSLWDRCKTLLTTRSGWILGVS